MSPASALVGKTVLVPATTGMLGWAVRTVTGVASGPEALPSIVVRSPLLSTVPVPLEATLRTRALNSTTTNSLSASESALVSVPSLKNGSTPSP